MVDVVITPGTVLASSGGSTEMGVAGETITAGKAVYKAANGKYMLADNNSATVAIAKTARGIALNGASLDQPLKIQTAGAITMGATLVPGARSYLSETPGGIQPEADLITAGENICLIGLATSASVLDIDIQAPGVAV